MADTIQVTDVHGIWFRIWCFDCIGSISHPHPQSTCPFSFNYFGCMYWPGFVKSGLCNKTNRKLDNYQNVFTHVYPWSRLTTAWQQQCTPVSHFIYDIPLCYGCMFKKRWKIFNKIHTTNGLVFQFIKRKTLSEREREKEKHHWKQYMISNKQALWLCNLKLLWNSTHRLSHTIENEEKSRER